MKPLAAVAASVLFCASIYAQTDASKKAHAGDQIFHLTKIHKIRLTIPADEWAVLQTSAPRGGNAGGVTGGDDYRDASGRLIHVGSGFGGYFPWAKADLRVDNPEFKAEFKDVGLRYKGNFTFQRSSAAAPLLANFKLKIDVHGTKGTWDGERTFNLHPGVVDTSKMRDAIAFAIFRGAGVPAPRTTYAEIVFTVPGVYNAVSGGLFTIIEDVNRKFLDRVLPPGNGLLMKPEGLRGGIQYKGDTWSAYVPTMRPDRDATPHEQRRVLEFARLISQADPAVFRSQVASYLDIDQFLRFVAVNALIVNTDSYIGGGHNYYFYLDPKDDRFRFIPWDQDLSMNGRGMAMGDLQMVRLGDAAGAGAFRVMVGGGPGGTAVGQPVAVAGAVSGAQQLDVLRPARVDQRLINGLLDDPDCMTQYRAILRELSQRVFSPAELRKLLDALESTGTGRGPSPRAFLEGRAAYLQQLVASWAVK